MGLRQSYTIIAPVYDFIVRRATRSARQASLQALGTVNGQCILLCGVGTGLDLPWLPQGAHYTGIDLTPAMLRRSRRRMQRSDVSLYQGDVMCLPHANAVFDSVVMHLILSVIQEPARALGEAIRVVRPGGRILIYDKFLRPGQRAPLRRFLSPLLARFATRTDVVFEEELSRCEGVSVVSDVSVAPEGWFRRIVLARAGIPAS